MTDAAVDLAGRMLAERIGLRLEGSAQTRLERTLLERARRTGRPPGDYAESLPGDPGELRALIDQVTVQESRFFRDPAHFAILRRLLDEGVRPGVVWCAGCANGQEPWSLAMLLAESGARDWQVLATDVSEAALARTAEAVYTDHEVASLSTRRRAAHLERVAAGWRVAGDLRNRVLVRTHNVLDEPPPEAGALRVVFCRNVLIYLRPEEVERALRRLAVRMPGDGVLFIGAGEALAPGHGGFVPERRGSAYVYRPARGDRPPPAPPRASPAPGPRRRAAPAESGASRRDAGLNLSLARERMRPGGD